MQVDTGNKPSFFLTWWFRTSNSEPPQLASYAIDLSKPQPEDEAQQTHTDDAREHAEDAHVADADGHAKHVHGGQVQAPRAEHKHHADEAGAHRAQPSIPPVDYHMFYPLSSEPFKIEDCAWAVNTHRLNTVPSTTALDNVPDHKRHKWSMVVKDKDLALRNATVTDTVVPMGQKVIHINCFTHAMMHLEKCAAGSLDEREGLRLALKWLKRIDEGNKVCVCCVCSVLLPLLCAAPATRTGV